MASADAHTDAQTDELPASHRPPLSRFDLLIRYGFVLAVMAYLWLPLLLPRPHGPDFALGVGLEFVFGLGALALLRDRRRHPRAVSTLTALCCFPATGALGAALVSYSSVCTRRRWREIVPPALIIMAAAAFNGLRHGRFSMLTVVGLVGNGFGVVLMTVLGLYEATRNDLDEVQRQRAAEARRSEQARLVEARLAERERIAREMHDVVAHRMSLVAMHAGALTYREDLSPEDTRQAALLIQENATRSLEELRGVLHHLRGSEAPPAAPQPTMGDVARLVADARAAGQDVDFDDDHGPTAVPDQLGRHVYRLVQEGLTNARKHAPGRPVTVRLRGRQGGDLHLEIRNPWTPGAAPGTGGRLGLVGMVERVEGAGGTIRSGPTDRDFVVTVSLPWPHA